MTTKKGFCGHGVAWHSTNRGAGRTLPRRTMSLFFFFLSGFRQGLLSYDTTASFSVFGHFFFFFFFSLLNSFCHGEESGVK